MWKEKIENQKRKMEIIKTMKPMFLYFLLSGVFPYKMVGQDLKFSKLGIFQVILNLSIMIFGYLHLFIGDPFNEVISKIEQTQFATVSIALLILFIFQFKIFKKHLKTALVIGAEIIDILKMKQKLRVLFIFEIVISSFLITSLHVSPVLMSAANTPLFYTRLDNKLYIFFLFFTNNFFLLECISINFMFYLKECFLCTNLQIVSMIHEMDTISNDRMVVISRILNGDAERDTMKKLKRLVKIRQKLLELTIDVNGMWFILLLSSSWISLFEIMFSAYYAVVFVFDGKSYDYEQNIFHNYLVAWMLYHALRFIFICFACEQLTKEVRDCL